MSWRAQGGWGSAHFSHSLRSLCALCWFVCICILPRARTCQTSSHATSSLPQQHIQVSVDHPRRCCPLYFLG